MKPLIADTSVWVEWLRGSHGEVREESRGRVLFMPAVVSMELLSGARTKKQFQMVSQVVEAFKRNRRMIVPSQEEYERVGSVLADLGWPASKKSNDVLISVCARKIGAEVWTRDYSDFAPIADALHVFVRKV